MSLTAADVPMAAVQRGRMRYSRMIANTKIDMIDKNAPSLRQEVMNLNVSSKPVSGADSA